MESSHEFIKKKSTLLALVVSTLFLAAYLPVLQILVRLWLASEEYSHAFLTLPIIFFIVWRKRPVLADQPVRNSTVGLVLLVICVPIYLFALMTKVNTVIELSMYVTIIGSIMYLAGVTAVKELITPLILLLMLIPVPNQLYIKLTFPLQLKVSQISEVVVRTFGVPIFREGNVMNLPYKSFEVVEACSGLRSVISMLTLSVIAGYFMLKKFASKVILFVAAVPTAIIVNVIRVVTLILMWHYVRLDLTKGTWHKVTGLLIFLIALLILFLLMKVLNAWETKSKSS